MSADVFRAELLDQVVDHVAAHGDWMDGRELVAWMKEQGWHPGRVAEGLRELVFGTGRLEAQRRDPGKSMPLISLFATDYDYRAVAGDQ